MLTPRRLCLTALVFTLLYGCSRQEPPASLWQSSPAVKGVDTQPRPQGGSLTRITLRPAGGNDVTRFLAIAAGDMRDVIQTLYLHLPNQRPDELEFRLQAPLVSRSGNSALVEVMVVRFDMATLQGHDWQQPPSPATLLEEAGQVEPLQPVAKKLIEGFCSDPQLARQAARLCSSPEAAAPH